MGRLPVLLALSAMSEAMYRMVQGEVEWSIVEPTTAEVVSNVNIL